MTDLSALDALEQARAQVAAAGAALEQAEAATQDWLATPEDLRAALAATAAECRPLKMPEDINPGDSVKVADCWFRFDGLDALGVMHLTTRDGVGQQYPPSDGERFVVCGDPFAWD